MSDILAIIGAAIDTVRKLRDAARRLKDAETQNLIADLSLSLADLKTELATLKEENLRLQTELKKRDERQSDRGAMEVRDGVLYFKEPQQGRAQGPYCPNCKERGQLVIVKDQRGTEFAVFGDFFCATCNSMF